MSKLKEKHINAELRSVQDTGGEKTEQLEQKQFLEEAEAIEKEIENIPDREEWKFTEEKFQRLMKKAKERGLIEEDHLEDAIDDKDDSNKNNEKITSEKLNMENNHAEKSNPKTKISLIRKKVVKRSAVAAAVVFGIFSLTMTSEANRAYIMQKIDQMLGSNVGTKINNNNDKMLARETTEDQARAEIENVLKVKLPQFFYMPDGMEFEDYAVDEEAQIGIVQYIYSENILYLTVVANDKSTTATATSDTGKKIDEITSGFGQNIKGGLWMILDENDEIPTYILQWEYKNSFYEFIGKIPKDEMEKIAENILF